MSWTLLRSLGSKDAAQISLDAWIRLSLQSVRGDSQLALQRCIFSACMSSLH